MNLHHRFPSKLFMCRRAFLRTPRALGEQDSVSDGMKPHCVLVLLFEAESFVLIETANDFTESTANIRRRSTY